MSPAPVTFPGELPAALRCGFCGQPIVGVFYRTFKRFACAKCAAEAETVARRNEFDRNSLMLAAIAGLGVALLFAAAWAAIVKITHWQIGIIAIFMGSGIGKTVYAASGKRRGVYLQWLSAILAGLSVALGKVGVFLLMLADAAKAEGMSITSPEFRHAFLNELTTRPQAIFSAFDLVWVGLASFGAWRVCKPVKIVVAGPYAYQPKSTSEALQFQTAEPADLPPSRPA